MLLFVVSRGLVPAVFGFLDYIAGQTHTELGAFLLDHYHAWDAGWYSRIATLGYQADDLARVAGGQTEFAFYPLMPLLARWTASLGGWDVRLVGIALSHLYFAGIVALFFGFCRRRGADPDTALWATALLALAPHSFVYSFFYTESLFVLLALATVTLLDHDRPVYAGLCGALLSATRANGLLIGIFFLVPVVQRIVTAVRERRRPVAVLNELAPWLLGGALVPLGLMAYWTFCLRETGDAYAQAHSLAVGWDWSSQPPWQNFVELFAEEKYETRFLLLWSAAGLGAACLLVMRRMPAEFLFCLLNLLLFWSGSLEQSLLRYTMALFPIYLGLALFVGRRPVLLAVLIALFTTTNVLLLYAWESRNILSI